MPSCRVVQVTHSTIHEEHKKRIRTKEKGVRIYANMFESSKKTYTCMYEYMVCVPIGEPFAELVQYTHISHIRMSHIITLHISTLPHYNVIIPYTMHNRYHYCQQFSIKLRGERQIMMAIRANWSSESNVKYDIRARAYDEYYYSILILRACSRMAISCSVNSKGYYTLKSIERENKNPNYKLSLELHRFDTCGVSTIRCWQYCCHWCTLHSIILLFFWPPQDRSPRQPNCNLENKLSTLDI